MTKSTKEKPTPIPCVCGKGGITVKTRSGKMITCPNPEKCPANLRTMWHSGEESAIVEWNGLTNSGNNYKEVKMKRHDMTEQTYPNGYAKGYEDGKRLT